MLTNSKTLVFTFESEILGKFLNFSSAEVLLWT